MLRNIARNKEQALVGSVASAGFYPDREKETVKYLSVVYSMPEELVLLWMNEFGEDKFGTDKIEGMLKAMLEVHPVTVRITEELSMDERAKLIRQMEESGVEVKAHPYLDYAYRLTHLDGVRNVPGYEEGLFAVQDVSSMLSVECAGIKEGNLVVDVCAAPGGKSMLAAQKLKGTGKVISRDVSDDKVAFIEENIERLGLGNIETEVFDATVYDEKLEQKADVVLADLPCSGLGILGKKRDIKYNVTGDMVKELPKLQKQILDTVWRYVKPEECFYIVPVRFIRKKMKIWFGGLWRTILLKLRISADIWRKCRIRKQQRMAIYNCCRAYMKRMDFYCEITQEGCLKMGNEKIENEK